MTKRLDLYKVADTHGYKYKRSRIGFSIYQDANGRVLEIGADYAVFLAAPSKDRNGRKRTRAQRITSVYTFDKDKDDKEDA